MAYGVKRGLKTPGEFSVIDYMGLALAGASGIIAALVTDYRQQGEASAIYTINQWVAGASNLLGLTDVPLYAVILGLIGIGAGSIFYFQPITRQGAFAQGFGLLAVLMTAVPADLAGGLQPVRTDILELEPISSDAASLENEAALDQQGLLKLAAYAPGEARLIKTQATSTEQKTANKYDVTLVVNFTNGLSKDVETLIRQGALRGRLHNASTNRTYNLFRSAGGSIARRGNTLIIRAGVPADRKQADLWVRIECDKYKIEQQSIKATLGSPTTWSINMQPSSSPLLMQRLNQSYWF